MLTAWSLYLPSLSSWACYLPSILSGNCIITLAVPPPRPPQTAAEPVAFRGRQSEAALLDGLEADPKRITGRPELVCHAHLPSLMVQATLGLTRVFSLVK